MKMQTQIRRDKMMSFLQTFEEQIGLHNSKIVEKVNKLKTQNEVTSDQRIETAMKTISDLEKRLFECERERVILRREKEQIERELRINQQQAS